MFAYNNREYSTDFILLFSSCLNNQFLPINNGIVDVKCKNIKRKMQFQLGAVIKLLLLAFGSSFFFFKECRSIFA